MGGGQEWLRGSASGRGVVNVNCHELTANFGELIFFNLRIIYGDSRSNKNYWGPLSGLGWGQELSGMNQEWSGMISLKNCWVIAVHC